MPEWRNARVKDRGRPSSQQVTANRDMEVSKVSRRVCGPKAALESLGS